MRGLVCCFLLLGGLTACGRSPQSLGITGALPGTPPEAEGDNVIRDPGAPQGNASFNPSVLPTTGGGRYYGY